MNHKLFVHLSVFPRAFLILAAALVFALPALAQRDRLISDIQGDKAVSPFVRQPVRVVGIVTARVKNGFFIQMPDGQDKNPATSDGIFVFTNTEPESNAALGNLVSITGIINEFTPRDVNALPVTQISMQKGRDLVQVLSKGNPLPKPVVLTPGDFLAGSIDQLERFEGMRVQVMDMTAVAPTDGRGVFYGVLTGTPRPFREPGLDVNDFLLLGEKEKAALQKSFPKLEAFDANPERIRVESTAQTGANAIDVSFAAELKNVTGVMSYSYRTFTILTDPDNKPVIKNTIGVSPLSRVPTANEFIVAGMNVENLFDETDDPSPSEQAVPAEVVETKMKKISRAVRFYMQMPDVIGIAEVENLPLLKRLAERINADAVQGGKDDPKYEAYLIEGNDGRGIDNGFLVKSSRVKVLETKQFGKDEKYRNPVKNEDAFVNDRPPLMVRCVIEDSKDKAEFTVIVNHLKSFGGYSDPKVQNDVRLKKKLQAEFLAKLVNERQKANANERIVLVGDFNMYQFNDGITDLIGTIKGSPSSKDSVMISSDDLIESDLTNLVDLIPAAQRYSYVFEGNAQVLDHIIINEQMKKHILGYSYARLNADFAETDRNNPNKVQRFSDHDPAVAYFTIADQSKK